MVEITLVELHVEDASFSAATPFSGLTDESTEERDTGSWLFGSDDEDTESDTTDAEDTEDTDSTADTADASRDVPTKALAAVGGLVALVTAAAVLKYLRGGDAPAVEIETAEDSDRPVGVTVDDE
jgi:hypothetical protein